MSTLIKQKPAFLDFFAGAGLVSEALKPYFQPVWANDISEKKAAVFYANHPKKIFQLGPIEEINGKILPLVCLSWASFPCQDLSLAGKMGGLASARSGLVWHWLRIIDEMPSKPPIVVAENVVGLISAEQGKHYESLHNALVSRGYRVGAVIIDASHWVPQSRKRIFVVATNQPVSVDFETSGPTWCHPSALVRVAKKLKKWAWWSIPKPTTTRQSLESLIDYQAKYDETVKTAQLLKLISPLHQKKLTHALEEGRTIFPAYKRIRNGRLVLELRFDGVAGCLRTPEGGSSRQWLVVKTNGSFQTRLITVREAASLMGVNRQYKIPGSYNDGYKAMGDAIAVPAVRYLGQHLLRPLADKILNETCK